MILTGAVPRNATRNLDARKRVVAWLRWYWQSHPDEFPTQHALAQALEVTDAMLTYVLAGTRKPGIEMLLAVRKLTGVPLDMMLDREPPALPSPSSASPSARPGRRNPAGGK